VIAPEVGGAPDEAYRNVTRGLAGALARHGPVHAYTAGREAAAGMRRVPHNRLMLSAALVKDLRRQRPAVIVYIYPVTLGGMLRARLLKLLVPDALVMMLALEPAGLRPLSRRLIHFLWPDLLLVSSEGERRDKVGLGPNVACFYNGIDLNRFRPPVPEEKEALRQKWGLPLQTQIVLHVGHLKMGRNLHALLPLAAKPGMTVVVLVSRHTDAHSSRLKEELQRGGMVIVDEYQPRVEELYRLADCYVFPVHSPVDAISMPLSVLEALASDLPVATTRFGALPERFEGSRGVAFVNSSEELEEVVEKLLSERPSTRHLAEPYDWDLQARQLLTLMREAAVRRPQHGTLPIAKALIRRQIPSLEDALRSVLWRQRMGFELRPGAEGTVDLIEPRTQGAGSAATGRPRSASVGVVAAESGAGDAAALADCARFYGLSLEQAPATKAEALLERATREGWPLLGGTAEAVTAMPEGSMRALREFLASGGTFLLGGIGPASNRALAGIGRSLGIQLPKCRELSSPGAAVFSGRRPDFAQEFAGTRIQGIDSTCYFAEIDEGEMLASLVRDGESHSAIVEFQVPAGRIILSAETQEIRFPLCDSYGPRRALAVLPPMMLIRQLYGTMAWHVPVRLANFTIDDPVLRNGLLGLDYRQALAQASDHNFHLTIATIPRDLNLAEREVVQLLRQHPSRLSACYHGNNHDGYEFYLPRARRLRWRSRGLAEQERALRQAAERGDRFAQRTGYQLERVMVFPHGLGPVALLPKLAEAGFLATCNACDRYPLEATPPRDPDAGMRPADLEWADFPLIWRRSLGDHTFPFDLFVGRPVVVFTHRGEVGRQLLPFVERASQVNAMTDGQVRWCGLEEIARHCYVQRFDPQEGWQVQMMADEICLHNPDSTMRMYRVQRPHRPAGSLLAAEGVAGEGGDLEVAVAAGSTALVRLARPGLDRRVGAKACSVFHAPPQ